MLDTIYEPEVNDLPAFISEPVPEAMQPTAQQCFHQITAGHRCGALALRGEYFCRHHLKRARITVPANTPFELPDISDRASLRAAVLEVGARVAANSLDVRRAGIVLYSLQIALSSFPPQPRPKPEPAGEKELSPEDARTTEQWARIFLARTEAARTGAPDPFDGPMTSHSPQPQAQSAEPQPQPDSATRLDEGPHAAIVHALQACRESSSRAQSGARRRGAGPDQGKQRRIESTMGCQNTFSLMELTSTIMESTMRIMPSRTSKTLPSALLCAALSAAVAVAPTQMSAQTAHSAAAHSTASHTTAAAHTGAATPAPHSAAGGCIALPADISPKVPAVPAGSPCPKALFTVTVQPAATVTYASPLEPDIAKTLGLETNSFTLGYIDTKTGAGALALPHKYYTVKYTGYLPDGTVFDASDKHAETAGGISFQIGGHHVIPGWDTGFAGMHVGGKRRLYIPYPLAYGAQGQRPTIPPQTNLIFDMELVSQSDTDPTPKPVVVAAPPSNIAPAAAPATPPAAAQPATPPAGTSK